MNGLTHQTVTAVVDLLGWLVWVVTLVRVARTLPDTFVHGWWTKTGRLVLAGCFYTIVGGVFIPIGAAVILVGLHRAGPHSEPLDLAGPCGPQLPD
jgi:hypothetical protein